MGLFGENFLFGRHKVNLPLPMFLSPVTLKLHVGCIRNAKLEDSDLYFSVPFFDSFSFGNQIIKLSLQNRKWVHWYVTRIELTEHDKHMHLCTRSIDNKKWWYQECLSSQHKPAGCPVNIETWWVNKMVKIVECLSARWLDGVESAILSPYLTIWPFHSHNFSTHPSSQQDKIAKFEKLYQPRFL